MNPNGKETIRLVCLLLEQQISAADFRRLNELLQQDAEARSIYVQSMHMHQQLPELVLRHVEGGSPAPVSPPTRIASRAPTRQFAGPIRWAVAAILMLAAVGVIALSRNTERGPHPEMAATTGKPESTDPNVAVVTAAIDVVWGDGPALIPGDGAAPGILKLKSGILHLEFYCGAAVLLEGPAELELKSSVLAILSSGRLRAHVPPQANGFTILSPQLKLVDRGTEFGVVTAENGETQVHVFDGLVELYPNPTNQHDSASRPTQTPSSGQQLSTGKGLALDTHGTRQEIAADTSDFVSFQQAARLADASTDQRQQRWLQWKREFQSDPRVYGWFDFDRGSTSRRRVRGLVSNEASLTMTPLTGALVGCRVADGRWPDETSLEFKHPGDRARLSLPEELESVTLMAWLRIDSLDRSFSGLVMSDDHDTGQPHWQINRRGEIVFGVRDNKALRNFKSTSVVDEFTLGRWIHLATVYDSSAGLVKHFLNGVLVSSEEIDQPVTLRFGETEIGNWRNSQGKTRTPIRSLNGRIDELILFRAALPNHEIQSIHELGRP